MRTIGLTVMLVNERGDEEKGDLVMRFPEDREEARKVLSELCGAALAHALSEAHSAFLVHGTMGLYLEVTSLDDRLNGYVQLHENAMAKVKPAQRITWSRHFVGKEGGDTNG